MTQENQKADLLSSESTAVRTYMHTYTCAHKTCKVRFSFLIHEFLHLQHPSAVLHNPPRLPCYHASKVCQALTLFFHLPHSWIVLPSSPPPWLSSFYSHNLTTWTSMSCKWCCSFFPHFISAKWSGSLEGEGKVGLGKRIRNQVKIHGREKKSN